MAFSRPFTRAGAAVAGMLLTFTSYVSHTAGISHESSRRPRAVLCPKPFTSTVPHAPALIARINEVGVSGEERIRILSELTGERLFTTEAHQAVLRALLDHCLRLSRGDFVRNNGAHARLLQGPKGIGKSSMLREFVRICPAIFPDIIPIYITFNDNCDMTSPFREKDISAIVAQQLRERGIMVADDSSVGISRALAATSPQQRVLLIVDEIDNLYRVSPSDTNVPAPGTPPAFTLARSCLGNLAFLGDRPTGLFGVLLCGSSAVCPLLITCNASKAMQDEFPLLDGAPNLNGQKYRVLRIPSPLPTDVTMVQRIMAVQHDVADVDVRCARLVTFVSGAAARNVIIFTGSRTDEDEKPTLSMSQHAVMARFADSNESALRPLSSIGGQLYKRLMSLLRNRNLKLMDAVRTDGKIDPDKVACVPWETMLQPLSQADVQNEWLRVHEEMETTDGSDMVELQRELFAMCDRGYLVYDSIFDGMPHSVFPTAAAQLFVNVPHSDFSALFAVWDIRLVKLLKEFGFDVVKDATHEVISKRS